MLEEDELPRATSGELLAGASGERLKLLLSEVPAAVAVMSGPEHVFEFVNARYEDIVGVTDLIGRTFNQALPELAKQGFERLLDGVFATHQPFRGTEVPVQLAGASENVYFDFVFLPTRDVNGMVDGVLVHATDVTENVNTKQRMSDLTQDLELERARLEALLEHLPAGVALSDTAGNITRVNSAYLDFFSNIPVDAVNEVSEWKQFEGFRPDGSAYEPDEYPLARTALQGETVVGELLQFHRDGEQVRTIELSSTPIRDDDGKVLAGVAVFFDITERLAMQDELATRRALEDAQVRIDKVLEVAGDGIIVLNADGQMTLINPAAQAMTGYPASEALGRDGHELFHHSYRDGRPYPVDECPIANSAREGVACESSDDVFWRKNGDQFPIAYRATPILEAGKRLGTVLVFRDLTTERKLQAEELHAQEVKLSREQALQLNDDVLQGLTAAQLSMELGDGDRARATLHKTIESMRLIINALLESGDGRGVEDMSFVRTTPTSLPTAGESA